MSERNETESELAAAVMAYLADHPLAMDTSKGIGEWWVNQDLHVDLKLLTRVLERLRAEGILEAEGGGEQTRYRLRHLSS
jgi:hypothetical protein